MEYVELKGFSSEPVKMGNLDEVAEKHLNRVEEPEKVVIENSIESDGCYKGRKDNSVRIGLKNKYLNCETITLGIRDFVLLHELGHDRLKSEVGKTQYKDKRPLFYRFESSERDLKDLTLEEAVADLYALNNSLYDSAPSLNRNPFKEKLKGRYSSNRMLEDKNIRSGQLESFLGVLNTSEPEEPGEWIELYNDFDFFRDMADAPSYSRSLRRPLTDFSEKEKKSSNMVQNYFTHSRDEQYKFWGDLHLQTQKVKQKPELDKSLFLMHYWLDLETSKNPLARKQPQFNVINSYMPEGRNFLFGENPRIWSGEDVTERFSQAYSRIDGSRDEIFEQFENIAESKMLESVEEFIDIYGFDREVNRRSIPHVMADFESSRYNVSGIDFPHNTGCSLGKAMYNNGLIVEDVIAKIDFYKEVAADSIRVTTSRGYAMDENTGYTPSQEQLIEDLEILLEK